MHCQTRRLPLLFLLSIVGSLSGCFTDDKEDAAPLDGLSGQVRQSGRPAEDAAVFAFPVDYRPAVAGAQPDAKAYYSATTGAGGAYAFTDIPAGRYNILASRKGMVAFLDSVAVTGLDQSLPTVTLNPPGALVGRMELQPHHSTLGSVVEVLGTPVFATVDEDGDFELSGLAPGSYRLRASSDLPDYSPAFLTSAVRMDATDTLPALRPAYSGTPSPGLSGRIRDTFGDAAVGAAVWAYPADYIPGDTGAGSAPYFSDTTGPGGIYILENVPKGVYNILASRSSWMAYRGQVEVTGQSQNLPADTLKLPGLLGGRVIMQDDHPALAAVVQVMGTPVVATVDDQGNFQLPLLAPGTYRLRAHSTLIDYAPAYLEAEIRSATGYLLETPLRPTFSGNPTRLLIGRLLNDRGPAVGVKVRVVPVDYVPVDTAADPDTSAGGYYQATTGAGGIYVFKDVPAGQYNVLMGNSIFRDSVTVTGLIQSFPLETARNTPPYAGRVLLQPHHSTTTVRVQVFGTPINVKVREDSTFQLPLGPGTYRLRVQTSLPDYAPIIRDIVHPGSDASQGSFHPRYSGIPVLDGLSATPAPNGTVVFSWNKPEYVPVEAYLIYRDSLEAADPSETPYARVGRTDTAWIDTVYSRAPRPGQYDYADSLYREHSYRVRILNASNVLGPLFFSVRGRAVPPTLQVDSIPPAPAVSGTGPLRSNP